MESLFFSFSSSSLKEFFKNDEIDGEGKGYHTVPDDEPQAISARGFQNYSSCEGNALTKPPECNFKAISLTAIAFVLINVELGGERDVTKALRSIPNVKEVHLTYGVYDIIAKIEGETQDKVKETITNYVRTLPNIRSTLTMVVV
jgi:DNA-binding Lrp family transcriptional regulator